MSQMGRYNMICEAFIAMHPDNAIVDIEQVAFEVFKNRMDSEKAHEILDRLLREETAKDTRYLLRALLPDLL
jgi:hypothetical protein